MWYNSLYELYNLEYSATQVTKRDIIQIHTFLTHCPEKTFFFGKLNKNYGYYSGFEKTKDIHFLTLFNPDISCTAVHNAKRSDLLFQ